MGCWNETCLASGFPIERGDAALAFVLARPSDYDPAAPAAYRTSASFEWTPVGFPLVGPYDGHGGLDDVVDDAFSRHTMSVLERGIADAAELREGPEALWRFLRFGGPRSSLADADAASGGRPVTFALARADVFDAMASGYREVKDGPAAGTPHAGRDARSIEAGLRRRLRDATCPGDVVGLRSACAPHGDLLDAVGVVANDDLCAALAALMAFSGALDFAGVSYGPRHSIGQDPRWPGIMRHHEAMAGVLATIRGQTPARGEKPAHGEGSAAGSSSSRASTMDSNDPRAEVIEPVTGTGGATGAANGRGVGTGRPV